MFGSFFSYFAGDKLVLAASGAREVTAAEAPQLGEEAGACRNADIGQCARQCQSLLGRERFVNQIVAGQDHG